MSELNYGIEPKVIGVSNIKLNEYMFYVYLPIKMPQNNIRIEPRLEPLRDLIYQGIGNEPDLVDKYVYLTVRNQFVPKGLSHNRPGWHSDGFGSNDVNYIFYSNTPTEFCIKQYKDISTDDVISLKQFEEQSSEDCIVCYPNNTLLRLTPEHIHRVGYKHEDGNRLFIKISISDKKYALAGNSHNYEFEYDWSNEMKNRELYRNTP